ncbi:MAG: rhodanese-like domain-containing protein [Mycolicibacterium rufum]|uniref:Thiosulfate sulfurtransferase PspE n=1 Tax=Mycolicibacterium chlorophenolicum TaxID=37916 RepID=A0A0J6Y238_9MYCO|nr:rhodanese-like domain-containing protein [Mycolicibacterium chlorophenolicum]KMO67291.1 Thiosulfate sulfurtransferase PspE precursor [Mycolicibacterium chlorophenolicum]MBI5338207.1 rhodanese-like domain-containing protein [Mycolicibacterium rufum]
MPTVQEVDIATFARARESGAPVLDVREDHEFSRAHVPGAQWIPLGELPARVAEVPAGTTVYVICASGNRSKRGAEILQESGRSAASVAGGTAGWIRAGHPAESG